MASSLRELAGIFLLARPGCSLQGESHSQMAGTHSRMAEAHEVLMEKKDRGRLGAKNLGSAALGLGHTI